MSSMDDLSSLLATLSTEEQAILRPVLERDLEFQRREKERVQSIKAAIPLDRKKSEVKEQSFSLGLTVPSHRGSASSGMSSGDSFDSSVSSSAVSPLSPLTTRNCNDCSIKLGILFNSGVRCIRCESLLCELCRVVTQSEKNASVYCKKCYGHRQVMAASGEWMGIDEDTSISATILTKMRRESEHRVRSRSPDQFRTRNMSLPPISGSNLLGLPCEQRPQSEVGDSSGKFWKGSPSPRSPFSPHQLGVSPEPQLLNSPAPRPLTPNSQPHNFIPQELEEEMNEEEMGAFPCLDVSRERILSWSTQTKKTREGREGRHNGTSNQVSSEQEEIGVRMRRNIERGGTSNSLRSSTQSEIGESRTFSSISQSQQDSISIGSFSSIDGGMSMRSLSSPSPYGLIYIRLQYQVQSASLSISILSCVRLPNIEGGIKPNPYVKILLVRKGASEARLKHKTRSKRATNDPVFNYEIHLSSMTKSELEEHVLRLSVCHRDLLQNSTVIGQIFVPLNNYPWNVDKCALSLEGKSDTPPDPSPSSLRKVRITTTFNVVDKERKIGTLSVHLQSITFHSSDTSIGPIMVCGKLFMGGKRMSREQSGRMRIPNPNPGKETSADHSLVFHNINLNDLHLQMFVLTLWEQNGLMSNRSMGQVILNHIQHTRNVPYPSHCSCNLCSPWYRLAENPSLSLSFPLPLSTATLEDPALSIL